MKQIRVVVPWEGGLHLRPAARLVRAARGFRSSVTLKCGDRIADLRSILGILALCAALGTAVDIQADGEDEQDAVAAVERFFSADADSIDNDTLP
jgi:phosphocarrier protein